MSDGKVVPVKRALLSVFDKTGLAEFAKELAGLGVELVSTGGTSKLIASTGAAVRDISDLTGFPEMMDGRVKTLHPKVHGGLLAVRDNPTHKAAMDAHEIGAIDLVVVNLYPFEETIARGASYDETIENIDIGGPAMIRSAAKNHAYVAVIVDPADYEPVLESIRQTGGVPYEMRQKLAAKAYARTAAYDSVISNWFATTLGYAEMPYRSFAGRLEQVMRYGENPHQWAAFYTTGEPRPGVATAAPGAGQGAELQQPQRHRRRLRAGLGVRSGDPRRRHHQARQSLRLRRRRLAGRGLSAGAPHRPGERLRRHRRAQPDHRRGDRHRDREGVHRGDRRPRRRPTRLSRSSPPRRTCACCSPGRWPTRRARASRSSRWPAASWCSRATTAMSTTPSSAW